MNNTSYFVFKINIRSIKTKTANMKEKIEKIIPEKTVKSLKNGVFGQSGGGDCPKTSY